MQSAAQTLLREQIRDESHVRKAVQTWTLLWHSHGCFLLRSNISKLQFMTTEHRRQKVLPRWRALALASGRCACMLTVGMGDEKTRSGCPPEVDGGAEAAAAGPAGDFVGATVFGKGLPSSGKSSPSAVQALPPLQLLFVNEDWPAACAGVAPLFGPLATALR